MLFREVDLPDGVTGALFLHSMPGRCEPLADTCAALSTHEVTHIVCLVSMEEAKKKSREYAKNLERNVVPCPVQTFSIPDYGVPADREAFLQMVLDIALCLREGKRVLVHCGAGKGRTGMFATCVIMALGQSREEAEERVARAGSECDTHEQEELLRWAEQALRVEPA